MARSYRPTSTHHFFLFRMWLCNVLVWIVLLTGWWLTSSSYQIRQKSRTQYQAYVYVYVCVCDVSACVRQHGSMVVYSCMVRLEEERKRPRRQWPQCIFHSLHHWSPSLLHVKDTHSKHTQQSVGNIMGQCFPDTSCWVTFKDESKTKSGSSDGSSRKREINAAKNSLMSIQPK